jgi:hypothetical protein
MRSGHRRYSAAQRWPLAVITPAIPLACQHRELLSTHKGSYESGKLRRGNSADAQNRRDLAVGGQPFSSADRAAKLPVATKIGLPAANAIAATIRL